MSARDALKGERCVHNDDTPRVPSRTAALRNEIKKEGTQFEKAGRGLGEVGEAKRSVGVYGYGIGGGGGRRKRTHLAAPRRADDELSARCHLGPSQRPSHTRTRPRSLPFCAEIK